ncbi:MAG: cobalamin biosynthesis protein CbiG [Actinomycetota bacterium]|nr:cobalamin biosynthesis protein CbiG [Actinomycetota bacterium]
MRHDRLFDVIVVVDWSANSTPKRGADSIWVAELDADRPDAAQPRNISTRGAAATEIEAALTAHEGRRVLVGFDFSFGYPAGFAAAVGLVGAPPWRAVWQHLAEHLADDERNRNNRWQVAADLNARLGDNRFWGVPPARASAHLTTRRPAGEGPLALRRAEEQLRSISGRRPFPAWQLLGAGAVGSQVLTGIPVLHRLRHCPALASRASVWPFETGLTRDPCAGRDDAIVFAEVWPSTVDLDATVHEVKDAQQVVALARHLTTLDATGALAARFAPELPPHVDPCMVIDEEGWVLQ